MKCLLVYEPINLLDLFVLIYLITLQKVRFIFLTKRFTIVYYWTSLDVLLLRLSRSKIIFRTFNALGYDPITKPNAFIRLNCPKYPMIFRFPHVHYVSS